MTFTAMQSDFFPDRESEILAWTQNLSDRLAVMGPSVGVSAEAAAEFADLVARFREALSVTLSRATRSGVAVIRKNEVRRDLEQMARRLSRVIQSHAATTDVQRSLLGLSIRPAAVTRLPAPSEAPVVQVRDVRGGTISLALRDAAKSEGSARPRGVAGAAISIAIGEAEPAFGQTQWIPLCNTSTTRTTIELPALPPNTSVWISARWYNPRGEYGPSSEAIQTWTTHAGPRLHASNLRAAA